jgi:hypothetical protein
MTHSWRTAWLGQDIVVYRDEQEVDRIDAANIQRIVFAHAGNGDSVGDLSFALIDTSTDALIVPADTGFGGRVNFERLNYWAERACVYWTRQAQIRLPLKLRSGWLKLGGPVYARLPRAELAVLLDRCTLEGPQTWEQRKWRRIEQRRPFADVDERRRA